MIRSIDGSPWVLKIFFKKDRGFQKCFSESRRTEREGSTKGLERKGRERARERVLICL